jgi:hypothetical protein
MKPADADLGVTIDFAKGNASPRRVFGSLITILEGLEGLDRLMIAAVDPRIVPLMVLEDVEAASITAWVRTRLRQTDDEVLKSGDWKKASTELSNTSTPAMLRTRGSVCRSFVMIFKRSPLRHLSATCRSLRLLN